VNAPAASRAGRTLLIGSRGMLGRAWAELLDSRGIPFEPLDRPDFDLTTPHSLVERIDASVGLVINCAAYTDVDGAEQAEALATQINATGVGALARRCAEVRCLLVHYGTDYVFDGKANRPYTVDHPRAPIGAYGRSKALGEEQLEASGCARLLIRTSWLYAPWGKNFVRTIAGLLAQRPSLRVVNDQRGRPTSAQHLARASLALVELGSRGTFHVSDGGECTWYDFATAIAAGTHHACRLEPCTTQEFPRPAPRPAYSVLDVERTEAVLGPLPSWQQNLSAVLRELSPP